MLIIYVGNLILKLMIHECVFMDNEERTVSVHSSINELKNLVDDDPSIVSFILIHVIDVYTIPYYAFFIYRYYHVY